MKTNSPSHQRLIIHLSIVVIMSLAALCREDSATPPGPKGESQESQAIRVQLQLTDVVVKDRSGNFIKGLGRDDFILEIDGKLVEIKQADEFLEISPDDEVARDYLERLRKTAAESDEVPIPPSPPRQVILIFDRFNLSDSALEKARELARRLIEEELMPYDRVMVLQFNYLLSLLNESTNDREKILSAIGQVGGRNLNSHYTPNAVELFPKPPSKSRIHNNLVVLMEQRAHEFHNLTESLSVLAKALEAIPGRKTILLFSEGPNIFNPIDEDTFASASKSRLSSGVLIDIIDQKIFTFGSVVERNAAISARLSAANSSLYSINSMGSPPEWKSMAVERTKAEFSKAAYRFLKIDRKLNDIEKARTSLLRYISDMTNGAYYDSENGDDSLLESLRSEIGNYYVLGFSPPEATPGSFHTISLRTKNPAHQVLHRIGFMIPKPFSEMNETERLSHLEEGLITPGLINDLDIIAGAYELPFKDYTALISFEINGDKLHRNAEGKYELEILVQVSSLKKEIFYHNRKLYESGTKPGGGKRLHLTLPVPLPDENAVVYLSVRENGRGGRSTWNAIYFGLPDKEEKNIVGTPVILSVENTSDIDSWNITDLSALEPDDVHLKPVELKLNGRPVLDGVIKRKEHVTTLLTVGRLSPDFSTSKRKVAVSYFVETENQEIREIRPIQEKIQYSPRQNALIVVTTLQPGSEVNKSGKLIVVFDRLGPESKLAAELPFQVQDIGKE